jgi:GlcNAc-PI de-N-acetylase.
MNGVMFRRKSASIYVPDGADTEKALERITHMCIAAHQDDIEMMASHGILECFGSEDQWFCGVVVTDGAGSPRDGRYSGYTEEKMRRVRLLEQKKAAFVGEYGAAVMLGYSSAEVRNPENSDVVEDIKEIISIARPRVIYTHNPADKHDTHVSVSLRVIEALRQLPGNLMPEEFYGCELWRGLDWMNDGEKVSLDISDRPHITGALIQVHDSQIASKRYDLAFAGRTVANAVYGDPYSRDRYRAVIHAMDLMPLLKDEDMDVAEYVEGFIRRFAQDTLSRIRRHSGK